MIQYKAQKMKPYSPQKENNEHQLGFFFEKSVIVECGPEEAVIILMQYSQFPDVVFDLV